MTDVRRAFFESFAAVRPLLDHDELERRWLSESALRGFSVRGLAGHLVHAGRRPVEYLAADVPEDARPVPGPHYYATVLPSMDRSAHDDVITRGEASAGGGPGDLRARYRETLDALPDVLADEPSDRIVQVFGGVVLLLDDYLVTRICEILIHTDDLAMSLGVTPPETPQAAVDLAIDHLVAVGRAMHGDRAVLMALSRRERDVAEALRIF